MNKSFREFCEENSHLKIKQISIMSCFYFEEDFIEMLFQNSHVFGYEETDYYATYEFKNGTHILKIRWQTLETSFDKPRLMEYPPLDNMKSFLNDMNVKEFKIESFCPKLVYQDEYGRYFYSVGYRKETKTVDKFYLEIKINYDEETYKVDGTRCFTVSDLIKEIEQGLTEYYLDSVEEEFEYDFDKDDFMKEKTKEGKDLGLSLKKK